MTSPTVAETPLTEQQPILTASDRCDRCGAAAKVRVLLNAGDLLFCRHHGTEHLPKLVEVALDVFVQPLD